MCFQEGCFTFELSLYFFHKLGTFFFEVLFFLPFGLLIESLCVVVGSRLKATVALVALSPQGNGPWLLAPPVAPPRPAWSEQCEPHAETWMVGCSLRGIPVIEVNREHKVNMAPLTS